MVNGAPPQPWRGTSGTVRIYMTCSADAVKVNADDPYRLARDIRGIGFKTADAIAARLGMERQRSFPSQSRGGRATSMQHGSP
jgi:exodeoxyribonuclease V alpha subunit